MSCDLVTAFFCIYAREIRHYSHKKTCTHLFTEALFCKSKIKIINPDVLQPVNGKKKKKCCF